VDHCVAPQTGHVISLIGPPYSRTKDSGGTSLDSYGDSDGLGPMHTHRATDLRRRIDGEPCDVTERLTVTRDFVLSEHKHLAAVHQWYADGNP